MQNLTKIMQILSNDNDSYLQVCEMRNARGV